MKHGSCKEALVVGVCEWCRPLLAKLTEHWGRFAAVWAETRAAEAARTVAIETFMLLI